MDYSYRTFVRSGVSTKPGEVQRVVETLTLLLVATVLFMWVIFAHPTPDERARLHDSMGASTGIAWR